MSKNRILGRLGLWLKACPIPPPRKIGAKIEDVLHARSLKSTLLCLWLLINLLIMKELIITPFLIAQAISPLLRFTIDKVVRVECPMDRPFYFESNDLSANFTLLGRPEGYNVEGHVIFIFSCNSDSAEGFYRVNMTVYCNGKEAHRILRDEGLTSAGGSHGAIEISIEEGDAGLTEGENSLLISIQLASMLHQYGSGLAEIEIGPANLTIKSLDMDNDGIPDSIDNLKANNQAIFLTLLLTTSSILAATVKKLKNSNSRDQKC